jgi:hypothetical protein
VKKAPVYLYYDERGTPPVAFLFAGCSGGEDLQLALVPGDANASDVPRGLSVKSLPAFLHGVCRVVARIGGALSVAVLQCVLSEAFDRIRGPLGEDVLSR